MIQARKDINSILAIGRLYEFCSNKRFHLIQNDFIKDEIGREALEINNNIRNYKGINVFEAKDEKDLMEYEKALNEFTTEASNNLFGIQNFGDELKLLEHREVFSIDSWSNINWELSTGAKFFIKGYGFSIPSITNHINNPDFADFVSDFDFYLTTKKVNFKNKERILLSFFKPKFDTKHFSRYSETSYNTKSYEKLAPLELNASFLFKHENFKEFLNNPTRLFVKFIQSYGETFQIDRNSSKFHADVVFPPFINNPGEMFEYFQRTNIHLKHRMKEIIVFSDGRRSGIALVAKSIFAIDLKRVVTDFLNGKI